jgi:perosamine synthetase
MTDWIPYGRQAIDDDDVDAVEAVLRSDYLTTGPDVARFEAAIAEFTGAPEAVVVSSGTAALHTAYAVAGIGPGDEVVMPPMTFAATANAAVYLGATPVFVDVDPGTGLIEPAGIEAAITDRTRALVAVDYAGQPADYAAIRAIADRHGLPVLADAAHSLGAARGGRSVGTLADLTVLSFHPVKHITSGEGGAILAGDADTAEALRAFRSHGIVRDPARLRRDEGPWYHEMQSIGFNYRLTDIQCALGVSQVQKLPRFVARRREIAARYLAELAGTPGLHLPVVEPDAEPSWHLFVVRVVDPARRRRFFEALHAERIGVQVHYIPVYRHPYYEDRGYPAGLCPDAEAFYARAISIPMYPGLDDAAISRVIRVVRDLAERVLGDAAA